jgi:SAM-dependent methyltransferase
VPRLIWPLPALLAWTLAWLAYRGLQAVGLAPLAALATAALVGLAMSFLGHTWWRRVMIAAGFPLAVLAMGAAVWPAWSWLVLLALLATVYPLHAWRDAPLFPTPAGALLTLPRHAPLPAGALVLDAGCGLGHGLAALRAAYPAARLHGIEWSWPLRLACALRCPWAQVRQGDIWRADWQPYDLVYLFQRPESMARAWAKASAELAPDAWLVSLAFEVPGVVPTAALGPPGARRVWVYRLGRGGPGAKFDLASFSPQSGRA